MFDLIEGGRVVDVQGLPCSIPPEGYVYNISTKKLEYRGVHKRSDNPEEQYWERLPLPSWYSLVMRQWDAYDKSKKDDSPEFYDEKLEGFKAQEWDRRLNGFWFYNNGQPVFLTGMHYLYLQWWSIDIGYPKYRLPDLEYFYFLQYVIEDNDCLGMLEVTKRRFGKTFRGGLFVTDYTTRTKMTNGTIQSKTGGDAKKVFSKAVVNPFRRLPRFFRPVYDTSLGNNPKTEMRFQRTNTKGKKSADDVYDDELGSVIDHHSADPLAQDGMKVHRGLQDEWAKCFAKGTKIRMFDGGVKNVEDIVDGELIMGDDSTPRVAYGCTNGVENMYRIIPNSGEPFECNESHILCLKKSGTDEIVNITVRDYLKLSKDKKRHLLLWKVGVEYNKSIHELEPYFLGCWLGDGNSRCAGFSTNDNEVFNYMEDYSSKNGLKLVKKSKYDYHISCGKLNGNNKILSSLKRLDLILNKHIPKEYLIDSLENRLQLLAGIIDTDGFMYKKGDIFKRYEISQKRRGLAQDIQELARSCGFKATLYKRVAKMNREDGSVYECDVYKVCIYGDLYKIPCKIDRKICKPNIKSLRGKNPLKSGFKIESIGEGEYYGFAVDKNNLFLLSDFTVAHNTTECDIYERHEVMRYCVIDDEARVIGKLLYTSTVEKLDSEKDGVQDGARRLWNDSDQTKRADNGRTISGLYRFFMSAKKARNFDKFGVPDEEKTIKQILADRETVKNNPRSLSARTRKEPLTWQEAFSEDADDCHFNLVNIQNQEQHLADNPVFKRNVVYYRDGETLKVKWRDAAKNELDFCWKQTQLLPETESNRFIIDNGSRSPNRLTEGGITVDSYSNSQGGRKYGSKASGWIGVKKGGKIKAIGHLYGRPHVKEKLHEQIMLAAEYWGFKVWYEHTSDDYLSYFRERGRINYLGLYPLSLIDPAKRADAERFRGTPLTPFSLTKQLDNGIWYFENHCGEIDYEEVLENAKKFDPYDRTKYDTMVSFLILISVLMEQPKISKPHKTPLVTVYPKN